MIACANANELTKLTTSESLCYYASPPLLATPVYCLTATLLSNLDIWDANSFRPSPHRLEPHITLLVSHGKPIWLRRWMRSLLLRFRLLARLWRATQIASRGFRGQATGTLQWPELFLNCTNSVNVSFPHSIKLVPSEPDFVQSSYALRVEFSFFFSSSLRSEDELLRANISLVLTGQLPSREKYSRHIDTILRFLPNNFPCRARVKNGRQNRMTLA